MNVHPQQRKKLVALRVYQFEPLPHTLLFVEPRTIYVPWASIKEEVARLRASGLCVEEA